MREKQFKKLEFSNVAALEHHHFSTEKHIPVVCAHEIAQIAARLAEDARDRKNDNLVRRTYAKDGKLKIETN